MFTSDRGPVGIPQLYLTAVVVDSDGVTTHGASRIPRLPSDTQSLMPVWTRLAR